eukprot:3858254-Amphidinium_carterae.1
MVSSVANKSRYTKLYSLATQSETQAKNRRKLHMLHTKQRIEADFNSQRDINNHVEEPLHTGRIEGFSGACVHHDVDRC